MILDGYLYTALELSNEVAKHRLGPLPSEPELITVASNAVSLRFKQERPFAGGRYCCHFLSRKPVKVGTC